MSEHTTILEEILSSQSEEEKQAIHNNGKLLELEDIHYARFSLYHLKSTETMQVSCSIGAFESAKFNKINFRLSNRGRNFYRNLPDDWQLAQSYNSAYDYFNRLTSVTKWIGKGTVNLGFVKGYCKRPLRPLTAMVVESIVVNDEIVMRGKCFIENAIIDFTFDIDNNTTRQSQLFSKHSEPINEPVIKQASGPTKWNK